MRTLRPFIPIICILAGFAILAGIQIPRESPWWDEIITLSQLRAPTLGTFMDGVWKNDPNMAPLHYVVAYYYAKVAGDSVVALRLLSLMAGLGSIWLAWRFAGRIHTPAAGLTAALLMALSLSHHYYSIEIRTYPFSVLLALASMYSLWLAADQGSRYAWACNTLCNWLLVSNHLFAAFLLPAQFLFVFAVTQRRWRSSTYWCMAQLPAVLLAAAWIRLRLGSQNMLVGAEWIPPTSVRDVVSALLLFTGGRPIQAGSAPHLPLGISMEAPLALLYVTLMAIPVIGWIRQRSLLSRALWTSNEARAWMFLMLWAGVPTLVLLAGSVWKPMFVPRYVLYSAPAYAIAAAVALGQMRQPRLRRLLFAGLLLCSGWQLISLGDGPVRPDWRAATEYLRTSVRESDTVVAYRQIDYTTCQYYRPVSPDRIVLAEKWSDVVPRAQEARTRNGEAWVIVWMWTPPDNIERSLKESGFAFTHVDFAGWPGLRVYRVAGRS